MAKNLPYSDAEKRRRLIQTLEIKMNKIELHNNWIPEEAPYNTTLAKYAFMLSKGKQYSIIEAKLKGFI